MRKLYSLRSLLVCTFLLCHIPLFLYLSAPDLEFLVCCDVNRYLVSYASKMKEGLFPYRDFESEYPPVALLLFLLPALVTKTLNGYHYLFVIEQLIFEVIGLFIIRELLRKMQVNRGEAAFVMFGYILLLTSVGPILYSRYDIVVSVMVLAAIHLFLTEKKMRAWVVLAISVMTKPYTLVIAPIFLITQLHEAKKAVPALLEGIFVFSSTLLVIAFPFLFLSFDGFIQSFLYHADRGIQIETLYSSIVHVLYVLGMISEVRVEFRYGAFELIEPVSSLLSNLAFFLTATGVLIVYLTLYKARMVTQLEPESLEIRSFQLCRASVMAILTFILFYKVFSAQFLIWVYPIIPLVCKKPELRAKVINGLLILIGGATQLIYPFNYVLVNGLWWTVVIVLIIRNGLLLLCLALIGAWSSIKIEKNVFQIGLLSIITLLGIFLLEVYPTLYHMREFPSKFNILVFLLAIGMFSVWNWLGRIKRFGV